MGEIPPKSDLFVRIHAATVKIKCVVAGPSRGWTASRFDAPRMNSMRAHVQQVRQDSAFYLASLEASHWFWERGYEVVAFRFADMQSGLLDAWLHDRPDETAVLAQQRIEFVSEWRVSILRNKILNVANYKGDPLRFPDVATVQSAIEAFSERPIAFGMDWGITAAGQTLLVEVNDGYALGNIGLSGMPYTAMIEARWRELMGLPDNGVGDCFTI